MLNFVRVGSPSDLKFEGLHGSSNPTKVVSKDSPDREYLKPMIHMSKEGSPNPIASQLKVPQALGHQ